MNRNLTYQQADAIERLVEAFTPQPLPQQTVKVLWTELGNPTTFEVTTDGVFEVRGDFSGGWLGPLGQRPWTRRFTREAAESLRDFLNAAL